MNRYLKVVGGMLDMGCIMWRGQEDVAGMVMETKVSDGVGLPRLDKVSIGVADGR